MSNSKFISHPLGITTSKRQVLFLPNGGEREIQNEAQLCRQEYWDNASEVMRKLRLFDVKELIE